jgi:hypothetical protein
MAGAARSPWIPLGFGLAALAASWNPVAAPFGLVVGIAATLLAFRALRGAGERRRIPAAALGTSLLAVVASVVVLALTAGAVGIELPGEQVVKARTQAEVDQVLSEAAERTRPRRERAEQELEALDGNAAGPAGASPRPRAPGRTSGAADGGAPGPASPAR